MSSMKQYKKDIQNITTTNLSFDDIKKDVIMKTNEQKNKKFILPTILTGSGILLGGAALALVIATSSGANPLRPNDKMFSLQALAKTATPLVNSAISHDSAMNNIRKSISFALATTETSDEEIIQDLLYQFDTIIENDNNYTIKAVESDKEEYKYKDVITFKDLLNNDDTYSLYYNEISHEEEIDEDEVEKETTYKGIAVKDTNEYQFKLELKEETEEDEKEVESVFYLYTSSDKSSYTKVTSASEVEGLETETEYGYEIYENGNLVTSYEMEIEKDPTENEVELSLQLNEREFQIEREIVNEEVYFHVEVENDTTDEENEWTYKKVIDGETVRYIIVE